MPRGSRSSGGRSSPFGSRRSASTSAPPPATPKPTPTPQKTTSQGPGLGSAMAQAASFGVGAGIGNAAVHSMLGTNRHHHHDQTNNQQQPLPQQQNPCAQELNKFLECADRQANNLSLCSPFNDFYIQCKNNNGLQ